MAIDVTAQVDTTGLAAGQARTSASVKTPITNLITVLNNWFNGSQSAEQIRFDQLGADPANPAASKWKIYAKAGGIYALKSDGTVVGPFGAAGAGGAPTDATYIVQTSNGDLTNEQALSALSTGLVKVTTTTGVLSTAANTDVPVFTGAGAGSAGTAGGVPTSSAGDQTKFLRADATWQTISSSVQYARMWDEKTNNTAGGGSTATTWTNRVLNTEYDPDGIVSIAANLFTPAAGTYHIHVSSPFIGNASSLSKVRLRLYNNTAGAAVANTLGPNHAVTTSGTALAVLDGYFTANGTDAYAIQYYITAARATDGLGLAVNEGVGTVEVYTVAAMEKIG